MFSKMWPRSLRYSTQAVARKRRIRISFWRKIYLKKSLRNRGRATLSARMTTLTSIYRLAIQPIHCHHLALIMEGLNDEIRGQSCRPCKSEAMKRRKTRFWEHQHSLQQARFAVRQLVRTRKSYLACRNQTLRVLGLHIPYNRPLSITSRKAVQLWQISRRDTGRT